MSETEPNSRLITNQDSSPAGGPAPRYKIWRRPTASSEAVSEWRIRKQIEIWETIVVVLATLATAWAGYEAGKWNSLTTALSFQTTAMQIEANQLLSRAHQLRAIDVGLFTNWVNAFGTNNMPLADFYRARFRDEFRPAFDSWIATRPLENADAPDSPFEMTAYRLSIQDEAETLIEDAGRLRQKVDYAASIGDSYTLSIVILAGALLLAGVANRFQWTELRVVVVIAALLVLLLSVVNIIRLPLA